MGQIANQVGLEIKHLIKLVILAAGGLVLILAASFLTANPQATFFRVLSLVGTLMLLFSVMTMILTFRKASTVKPGALLVSLSVALGALSVQMLMSPALPPVALNILAFAGGSLVGFGWSRTRLFFVDGAEVRCRGTAWYLAIWGGTFALHQLMSVLAGGAPLAVASSLLVGSGIVLGSTGEQFFRWKRISNQIGRATHSKGVLA